MATQPDLVDPEQEGEHEHQMFEAYQTQDQSLGNQQDRLFPPQTYEQDQLGQRTVPRHPLEDAMPSSSPHPGPAAASADFMPIMDAGSDAFDADMLSGLDVLRRPPPPEAKQSTDNPDWVPLLQAEVARPDLMYDRNPSDQEGAAMEATLARDANLTNVSHEQHLQDFRSDQEPTHLNMQDAGHDTAHAPQEEPQQLPAPVEKRRKRRLRRKRVPEPAHAQLEDQSLETSVVLHPRVLESRPEQDQFRTLAGSGGPGDCNPNQTQEPHGGGRSDSPHFQLQNEMHAAAVEEGRFYRENHDQQHDFAHDEGFQRGDQHVAIAAYRSFLQPTQNQYGPPEMRLEQTADAQPEQCPSSDILGDATQEFEHRIYRKQQAKSAKHQAERNAWQRDLRQELQAKQALQDRLDILQREKDDLNEAVEKQKRKVAGLESTANKLKTFIGGLANDMNALKRDANSYRQQCSDAGEEANEHKKMLDGLLQQLNGSAAKSSQLKEEAMKACHVARTELSAANMHASHLQEQLKEKIELLAEEKAFREQIHTRVISATNCGDALLETLRTTEKAILDKVAAIATPTAGPESEDVVSEQLEKILAAVQELNGKHTATVTDVVSVKGIVERLAESLRKRPDDAQHQTNQEPSLERYIDEALTGLRTDLCRQEELAAQDATNREAISGLVKQIEDVNNRMADCNKDLTTTRENEAQLKEQNVVLEARIATLQSQGGPVEQDAAQLVQLKAELSLKVQALQTIKSELDAKASALREITLANAELRSQVSALQSQLQEGPTAVDFDIERTKLAEKHREEVKKIEEEMRSLATKWDDSQVSKAANTIKQLKADNSSYSKKLADMAKDLETTKKRLELQGTNYPTTSRMQGMIDSAEKLASDRKKEVDVLEARLTRSQHAENEVSQLKSQLVDAGEVARKAIQEKGSSIEQMRRVRRECKETENRLDQQLQQCRSDSEEMERRLNSAIQAAEEHVEAATKRMQESAEETIVAERRNHVRQVEALQKSLQDLRTDLQTRIETDEGFREDLQRSWQNEEKKNQAKISELNDKISEAEAQRDEAIAENEQLREDLAKSHRPTASTTKGDFQPIGGAQSIDPRLQNRRPQPGNELPSQLPQEVIQHAVDQGTKPSHLSAPIPGPIIEETQQEPFNVSQYRDTQLSQRGLVGSHSQQHYKFENQKERGSVVEESQQRSYDIFGASHKGGARQQLSVHPSERPRGPVVEESQQQSSSSPSQLQDKQHGRGQLGEQCQQEFLPSSPDCQPSMAADSEKQYRSRLEAESGTQFVPETQYESTAPVEMPSFAHFNSTSALRRGKEHEIASSAFESPPNRAGSQPQRNAPRNFRKSMPPPNIATKMVRRGTDSSSLSSLSQEDINSLAFVAPPTVHTTAGTNCRTPEPGTLGGKTQQSQSIASGSSPNFVEQMANGHSQNTYHHSGGSGQKGVHHQTSHREPRVTGPKRKADSQVVPGYEQERKKKQANRSSQGDGHIRSSRGEGHALSELVAAQNRMSQTPSSSRGEPRFLTQPSRMQTLAGATSSSTIRQTRNTTRKLTKNEEMNARFAKEINSAR